MRVTRHLPHKQFLTIQSNTGTSSVCQIPWYHNHRQPRLGSAYWAGTRKKWNWWFPGLWFFKCARAVPPPPPHPLFWQQTYVFCLKLPQGLMFVNSKGCGETACLRRLAWAFAGLLVAYVISVPFSVVQTHISEITSEATKLLVFFAETWHWRSKKKPCLLQTEHRWVPSWSTCLASSLENSVSSNRERAEDCGWMDLQALAKH